MPGELLPTAAILSPTPIACSALTACGLTLTRGADLAELRRLLEHLGLDADGSQRMGRGEPREPAADNRDPAA